MEPDLRLMSMDRWKIWTINEETELVPQTKRVKGAEGGLPRSIRRALSLGPREELSRLLGKPKSLDHGPTTLKRAVHVLVGKPSSGALPVTSSKSRGAQGAG